MLSDVEDARGYPSFIGPKYGPLPFWTSLGGVLSMGLVWYVAYSGYVRIPDAGPILRSHGFGDRNHDCLPKSPPIRCHDERVHWSSCLLRGPVLAKRSDK